MKKWGSRRALACMLAWAAAWCVPAAAQMQMPGSFAVNERGAATYTIPVRVPPGVAGVEPKLELVYNSQRGNGLLGMGWSLSGLSSITRCPQTLAQDPGLTVSGAVKFDAADRFCLDGQRLMVVSGTYGAAGSEYRTEQESFSKISAVGGTTANGPEQFVVKTRSGQTMTYGGTADSRLEAQGKSVVAVWSLSKVSDIKGNTLTITYTEDSANGVSYPARIDYTANAATGLAAANVVYFDYEARPDVVPTYHAGSLSKSTTRMTKVRTATAAGATPVLEYRLGYGSGSRTGRSIVESVTMCTAANECLPATRFGFAPADATAWTSTTASTPAWANDSIGHLLTGDINGDGRTDLVFRGNGWVTTPVLFANGDGTWTPTTIASPVVNGEATTNWINHPSTVMLVGDFNADGKDDLSPTNPSWHTSPIFFSNGDGSWRVTTSGTPTWANADAQRFAGDFNGDGRTDIAFRKPDWSTTPILFSNGDGTWTATALSTPAWKGESTSAWINNAGTTAITGDFDGDGKTDFALKNPVYGTTPVFLSNGDGSFRVNTSETPSWASTSAALMLAGDYNGDGKTDLAFRNPASWTNNPTNWTNTPILFAKGDGTWVPVNLTPPSYNGQATGGWINNEATTVVVGDYNGDGRDDLAMKNAAWAGSPIFLSNGDGTWVISTSVTPIWAHDAPAQMFVGDYNGDGKADLAFRNPGAWSTNPVLFAPSSNGEMPSTITQGLGAGVAITTKTLPQAGLAGYQKSYVGTAPQLVITPPLPVVTETRQTGVPGETRTARYSYDSAVAEIGTGRGFLGFHKVQAKDEEFGTWTQTEYRLDWPFTGLPKATYVTARRGVEPLSYLVGLSDKQTHYTCQNPATAPEAVAPGAGAAVLAPGQPGNCVVTPGARYQVWASRSTEQRKDLTGLELAAQDLPGTRTDVSDMDKYGNAARVRVEALLGDGTASGHYQVTDTFYSNDPANWILGRPLRSSVKAVAP
jgi:hypothetical protein